ncbi:8424_t:CDS:2, partial [Racocetra fulgida]
KQLLETPVEVISVVSVLEFVIAIQLEKENQLKEQAIRQFFKS